MLCRPPHEEPPWTAATSRAEIVRGREVTVDDLEDEDALAEANRQSAASRQMGAHRRRPIADDNGMAARGERMPASNR